MRSVSTVVRLALAAFAFGGCTGHNRVETFTQDRVGTFIYEGWILGFSSAKIREHLGAPIKVIAEPIENRNVPGQTDEIRDVLYPGLTPQFYVVNENPERELLSHISVTNG